MGLFNRWDEDSIYRLWEKQRQFTLCNETGEQAESGRCPVHGGDACLYQYIQANSLVKDLERIFRP